MNLSNVTMKATGAESASYHDHGIKRGDPLYPVSSTMLKDFSRCPHKWLHAPPKESDSLAFGSLVDCLLLTPGEFAARYAVMPEGLDGRTKDGKAWKEAHADKLCIAKSALDEANKAVDNCLCDPIIASLVGVSEKQVWIEGTHKDEATGITVPVRCLIDLVPSYASEYGHDLADFKTTRDGSPFGFNRSVNSWGYHLQAAWNLALWNAEHDETKRDRWRLVGVENSPPYQTFRRELDPTWIELGRNQIADALDRYCQCLKSGDWPGWDDNEETGGFTTLNPERWMLNNNQEE